MGAGVLSLPNALYFAGAVSGTICLVVFAICSCFSMIFLARSARILKVDSFEDVGERVYGCAGKSAVRISLLVLLFGATTAYFIVVGDLSTPVVCRQLLNGTYNETSDVCLNATASETAVFLGSKPMCTIFLAIVPFVLSLLHSLKPLQFSSMGAVVAVVVVCVFIIIRSIQGGLDGTNYGGVENFPTDVIGFTIAFPLQSVAFCSQFNVIELQKETREAIGAKSDDAGQSGRARAKALMRFSLSDCGICISVLVVGLLYMAVGFAGYFLFGSSTGSFGNILNAFPLTDLLIEVGSMLVVLTVVLKLPLVLLPLRQVLNSSVCQNKKLNPFLHVLECFALIASCTALAIVLDDLALAFQFLGCIGGTAVCFVMPGMFYYKTMKIVPTLPSTSNSANPKARYVTVDTEMADAATDDYIALTDKDETTNTSDSSRWCVQGCMGLTLAIFGALCGIVSLAATILEMVDPSIVEPSSPTTNSSWH